MMFVKFYVEFNRNFFTYLCNILISEESLAHKVCLLLIELHIVTEQTDAALSLINYIESQLISTDNSKVAPVDKEGIIKSMKEQKKEVDISTDAFKIKLLKCKARIYLMTHQLKLCKREWKMLVSLGTPVVRYYNYILSM